VTEPAIDAQISLPDDFGIPGRRSLNSAASTFLAFVAFYLIFTEGNEGNEEAGNGVGVLPEVPSVL
jgi:hypothetical protein